eukprot:GEMP01030768.1.p1 GENE.GEMP01030768.1~~GEMP01030768.1.p1  ORF type:complete len:269 (-),score=51.17 GEMP01030768.1:1264-2070(-)
MDQVQRVNVQDLPGNMSHSFPEQIPLELANNRIISEHEYAQHVREINAILSKKDSCATILLALGGTFFALGFVGSVIAGFAFSPMYVGYVMPLCFIGIILLIAGGCFFVRAAQRKLNEANAYCTRISGLNSHLRWSITTQLEFAGYHHDVHNHHGHNPHVHNHYGQNPHVHNHYGHNPHVDNHYGHNPHFDNHYGHNSHNHYGHNYNTHQSRARYVTRATLVLEFNAAPVAYAMPAEPAPGGGQPFGGVPPFAPAAPPFGVHGGGMKQ